MKIAVALSGGTDSTTVALRLKEQGHEVVGLTMRLCPDLTGLPGGSRARQRARQGLAEHGCPQCVAPCACVDARQAAGQLGIRHEILDFRKEFERAVIGPFVEGFGRGETPNPCSLCNREMKFGRLLEAARSLGAEFLATGHYARVEQDGAKPRLFRALDRSKDQTYFLALVPNQNFSRALFPLAGDLKSRVKEEVAGRGLGSSDSFTSTEICFLRENSHVDFLLQRKPEIFQTGSIVDTRGKILGNHAGLPRYTVGQRKGIGLSGREPWYVVRLLPEKNQLVVGSRQDLMTKRVRLKDMNWQNEPEGGEFSARVQIRYRQLPAEANVRKTGKTEAVVEFAEPVRAVTPGQIGVLYQADELLGGGVIV